jgi:hypothetical protein
MIGVGRYFCVATVAAFFASVFQLLLVKGLTLGVDNYGFAFISQVFLGYLDGLKLLPLSNYGIPLSQWRRSNRFCIIFWHGIADFAQVISVSIADIDASIQREQSNARRSKRLRGSNVALDNYVRRYFLEWCTLCCHDASNQLMLKEWESIKSRPGGIMVVVQLL